MAISTTSPPGYDHRRLPRTVRPDVQKIIALLRQRGCSEQQFAEACGRGDAGFFRHWKKNPGATCYVRLLITAAKALGLDNWWELWADYAAPAPPTTSRTLEECLIEDFAVQTLLNPTHGLSATGQPLGTTDFYQQLLTKFEPETRDLLNNADAFKKVFRDLESMGWLIANTDGTFSRRYWTLRECMASIEYRCGAEEGAMFAVAMLQEPRRDDARENLDIYGQIMEDQCKRLTEMKSLHKQIVQHQDEDAAASMVKEDDAFHLRWPFTPCISTSFGFALKTIDQSTNRFIETLKRCKERGIPVPADFPTLPALVQNYYPDLENIFTIFTKIRPNDVEGMVAIRQLLRKHALSGFNTAWGAEQLIARWPRTAQS